MKKSKKLKRACPAKLQQSGGFSLLELLIVITIIGLLTSIVLSSVSQSRARAYDSKIKQQLSSFRTAAEIYFSNQSPNGYGPAVSVCTSGIFSDVSVTNGTPGVYLDPANLPTFTQVVCQSTDSTYAVKATLYSGNEYWCVDNAGVSKAIQDDIGDPTTVCP